MGQDKVSDTLWKKNRTSLIKVAQRWMDENTWKEISYLAQLASPQMLFLPQPLLISACYNHRDLSIH